MLVRCSVVVILLLRCVLACFSQVTNFPIAPFEPQQNSHNVADEKTLKKITGLHQFADGLILKSVVSNTNPYTNELVQVKWELLYPNVPGLNVDYKIIDYQIPALPDFVKEWNIIADEDDKDGIRSLKLNGVGYRARTLLCFYMYPHDVGKYQVGKGGVTIQLYNEDGKPYSSPIVLMSKAVDIDVCSLNNPPVGYCGGIGDFSISSSLLTDSFFVGRSFVYRVVLKGSGNFKFIGAPIVQFPDLLEHHPVKGVNHVNYTCSSSDGESHFDFLVTPHDTGDFVIPASKFVFYSKAKKGFETLRTSDLKLHVNPAVIKNNPITEEPDVNEHLEEGNSNAFLPLAVVVVVILLLVVAYLKIRPEKETEVSVENFEEEAVAGLMYANSNLRGETFYKNIVDLLLDYISNKLNYKVSTQSKTVLASILSDNGINNATIEKLVGLINLCEQVCYSREELNVAKEQINSMFCEVIDELKTDFDKSINCSKLN